MHQDDEHLYLARREDSPVPEWKAGRSSRPLTTREGELGGQTDVRFTLVRAFPTKDCVRAEKIAFERIDTLGYRKHKGTRCELVLGEYEELCTILEEAAAQADREYVGSEKEQRDELKRTLARQPFQPKFRPKSRTCAFLLQFKVSVNGKSLSLHELLEKSLHDGNARRVLRRHGLRVTGERIKGLEFEVAWFNADKLVKWFDINRKKLPSEPQSRFLLPCQLP